MNYTKKSICFATNNSHKLDEVRHILKSHYYVHSLAEIGYHDELAEDFETLEENSKQKAEFVFKHFAIDCFVDDTGLEVDFLNGEPGVYSARYAGPQRNSSDNTKLLLQKMEGVSNRKARFRTVVTLINKEGMEQFEGIVNGEILHEPIGTQGFGYDPVFRPEGFSQSLAQMSMEEKNKISHRALAVRKLTEFLLHQ